MDAAIGQETDRHGIGLAIKKSLWYNWIRFYSLEILPLNISFRNSQFQPRVGEDRMDDNNLKILNEARISFARTTWKSGNWGGSQLFRPPKTQEERDLASFLPYELSKNFVPLQGKFSDAKSHAVALEQLKPTSQVIRS